VNVMQSEAMLSGFARRFPDVEAGEIAGRSDCDSTLVRNTEYCSAGIGLCAGQGIESDL